MSGRNSVFPTQTLFPLIRTASALPALLLALGAPTRYTPPSRSR